MDYEKIAKSLKSQLRTDSESQLVNVIEACDKLFKRYNDAKIVAKKTGISKKLVERYVKYARLPPLVQDNLGAIHPNPKTAVALALKAVTVFKPGYDVSPEKVLMFAKKLGEAEIARKGHQAKYYGHLRDDEGMGGIVGDGYSFGGCKFAVIVVGDDKGIFKNGKKMTREEFEKLPDEFRNILRLQPTWE